MSNQTERKHPNINRGRYVHASVCPRTCVAAKPAYRGKAASRRVSRQSRVSACRSEAALRRVAAKPRGEAAACRGKAAASPRVRVSCDPPCGRAQLVMFLNLAVRPSFRPSVIPSVCPSVRLSVRPSVRPSVYPSIRPSIRLSVRPSVCPSIRSFAASLANTIF